MKLPETIYVKIETDREEEFLVAGKSPSEISEENETIPGGEYQLVRKIKIINETSIK